MRTCTSVDQTSDKRGLFKMAELYSTYLEYHLVYLVFSSQLLKHWPAMVVLPELESKGPCYISLLYEHDHFVDIRLED